MERCNLSSFQEDSGGDLRRWDTDELGRIDCGWANGSVNQSARRGEIDRRTDR